MANSAYLVGETVRLRMRVSVPGTRDPADPVLGCRLAGLARAGAPVVSAVTAFTKVGDGDYVLDLDTSALPAGTYSWLGEARDSATLVALVEDSFVLRAPATPLA